MNYNKVMVGGRLTREPELKKVGDDISICNIGLAVSKVVGKGPNRKEETCFIEAVAWRQQADVIAKYLHKGDPIFVEGRLTLDQWMQDGQNRSKIKITVERVEFIGSRKTDNKTDNKTADQPPPKEEDIPW